MLLAVHISSYGCTWEVWRALQKLELLSAAPQATLMHFLCTPNFPHASLTQYMHATHEQILKYQWQWCQLWCNIKINDVNSPVDAQQPSQSHFYHQFSGDEKNTLLYLLHSMCVVVQIYLDTFKSTKHGYYRHQVSQSSHFSLIITSFPWPHECNLLSLA